MLRCRRLCACDQDEKQWSDLQHVYPPSEQCEIRSQSVHVQTECRGTLNPIRTHRCVALVDEFRPPGPIECLQTTPRAELPASAVTPAERHAVTAPRAGIAHSAEPDRGSLRCLRQHGAHVHTTEQIDRGLDVLHICVIDFHICSDLP